MSIASPRIDEASSPEGATFAPAKINLALHVTGRRPDGYHDIETLAIFARFGDRVTVAPGSADSLTVTGRYAADVPTDGTNLVLKARDALRRTAGKQAAAPVAIGLEKNLPVASGVGGGSSDAAATLRALSGFWGIRAGESELRRIGLDLGADLPMCLAARPLVARGIGDRIEPAPEMPPLGMVLVNPGGAVPTAAVFGRLERRDNAGLPPLPLRFGFHDLLGWLAATRNDLEPAAGLIEPGIGTALVALKRANAAFARMSGSGATCFGLFESGNMAKRAAAAIRARHPGWFVAATRNIGREDSWHGKD